MPVKAHLWKSALSNRRGNNTASDLWRFCFKGRK